MNKFISLAVAGLAAATMSNAALADGAAKFVGNITQSNTAPGANDQFTKLWNQATAENGCKWESVQGGWNGGRNVWKWEGCDAAYQWAKKNGGYFKFHALLWGSQYPSWLEGLSVDETKKAITTWFDAVAERYPDADMIDVANEAIRNSPGSYHSNYHKTNIIPALGGDNNDYKFLTTAFEMARKRWPKAVLIYNDYNTIQWDRDKGIALIQTLQKNNTPIDAYGLQAHDLQTVGGNANGTGGGGNCLPYNEFKASMEKIHKETNNIPIYISEYDIATTDDAIQKQCYQEQISYWMEDEYVAGITLWGSIYGHTWTNDGKGYSGIIKDGQDRPAMTWLKEYLAKNKGKNSTGLTGGIAVEPEPQTPFGGKAWAIPGKIEAENFDVPGVGTGNDSYYDKDSENHGDSDYRKGTGVDIYQKKFGKVIGYNQTGEWFEYTVNVAKAGTYTVFAAVASNNDDAGFKLSVDGKDVTSKISVPKTVEGEGDFEEFGKVSAEVALSAGQHILRLSIEGDWMDIDYMTFVEGKGATDPEPIETPSNGDDSGDDSGDKGDTGDDSGDDLTAISMNLNYNSPKLIHYDVFSVNGMFMGRVSGYNIQDAITSVKDSNILKSGVYCIRSRANKQMQTIRIAR